MVVLASAGLGSSGGAGCAALIGADFDRPAASDGATAADADGAPSAPADGPDPTPPRDSASDAGCVPSPTTCAGHCGKLRSACGDIIDCGACPGSLRCGGGGANVCGTGACTPNCAGKSCGASDECESVCTVGACAAPDHGSSTCRGGVCEASCDPGYAPCATGCCPLPKDAGPRGLPCGSSTCTGSKPVCCIQHPNPIDMQCSSDVKNCRDTQITCAVGADCPGGACCADILAGLLVYISCHSNCEPLNAQDVMCDPANPVECSGHPCKPYDRAPGYYACQF